MEGSAPGPASTGPLDPSVINGNSATPLSDVPVAGPPPGQVGGNAPGPAATALPQQPAPQPQYAPQPVAELNTPAESIYLTELQELKAANQQVVRLALLGVATIVIIGLICAALLTTSIKSRMGDAIPAPPVVA
jgi:hypothetical protein